MYSYLRRRHIHSQLYRKISNSQIIAGHRRKKRDSVTGALGPWAYIYRNLGKLEFIEDKLSLKTRNKRFSVK